MSKITVQDHQGCEEDDHVAWKGLGWNVEGQKTTYGPRSVLEVGNSRNGGTKESNVDDRRISGIQDSNKDGWGEVG